MSNRLKDALVLRQGISPGWALGFALLFSSLALGEERAADSVRLKGMTLAELVEVEVISPARKPQRVASVPTAIEVLSSDDIARSAAPNIPEALRFATGVHVARSDAHTWAISARGFNTTTANKMQVLMDGRSLYTPLFSGVFWDVQDTVMEDIDRIEVVRGPGAAMWGANALNGVINIITKSAKDTQGVLVSGGGGTEERGFGTIRYGGKIGQNTYYRAYAKYFNRDDLILADGHGAHDEWNMGQTGFRVDSDLPGQNQLTAQGDLYYGEVGQFTGGDIQLSGGNVLGRWTHAFSTESELQLQLYYDRIEREIPRLYEEDRNTYDFELQHNVHVGERHGVVWGFNYRLSQDQIGNPMPSVLAFLPDHHSIHLFSGFIQDQVTLVEDLLNLTLGTKLEHNDFTGFEWQPSARLAYTPAHSQTVWAAVSRAVRTPTRIDHDLFAPGLLLNDSGFDSEELIAYELGYRIQPHPKWQVDLATFYHDYDDLRSQEPLPSGARVLRNQLEGETYGVEIAARFQPTDWWRLQASYTLLEKHLHLKAGSMDVSDGTAEGNDPGHMLTLRSAMSFPRDWTFDWMLRYVDQRPAPDVPSYLVMDLRLAWEPIHDLEVALGARNLLDDRHPEFGAPTRLRKEIQHSVYGKVTWRF